MLAIPSLHFYSKVLATDIFNSNLTFYSVLILMPTSPFKKNFHQIEDGIPDLLDEKKKKKEKIIIPILHLYLCI